VVPYDNDECAKDEFKSLSLFMKLRHPILFGKDGTRKNTFEYRCYNDISAYDKGPQEASIVDR